MFDACLTMSDWIRVNPMLRKVANSWKETFDTHIPSHTKALAQRLQATFHKFHAESLNLADGHIPDHRRKLVDSALRTSCQTLARQLHVEEQIIKMNQKAVNRIHVGSISQELNATYSACFEIRGTCLYRHDWISVSDTCAF